jgi:hypothetical protein
MEYTVAQRVKGILVSSGHNDKKRAAPELPTADEMDAARRAYDELGRTGSLKVKIGSGDYFTSDPDGDGALVRYYGSVYREEERLRLYRLAIENCSFRVAEEEDPERPGRAFLRVIRVPSGGGDVREA